jgi:hypothetical protein
MPTEKDASGKSQWVFIPADCVALLPFTAEPLHRWRSGNDISRFIRRLACEDVDLDAVEERAAGTSAPDDLLRLAEELSAGSTETYHERLKLRSARIDYGRDPVFGGFAKAWAAWQAVETELLTEDGSFSLAHTLETTSDIECAVDLVKRFYYRHATICLRTFVEDLVYPLYFLHHRSDYDQWKAGQGRLPRMRGNGGILDDLVKRGAVDDTIAKRLGATYQSQNHAVHGAAATLLHQGTFNGAWRGRSFKVDELARWLEMAKECLECGIVVVKRLSDDWLAATRNNPHFCRRCHSKDLSVRKCRYRLWVPVEITLGNVKFTLPEPRGPRPTIYVFRCRRCGSVWHGTIPEKRHKAARSIG